MSAENVDVGRRLIDAFNRRDIDGIASLITLDFEWATAMGPIEGGEVLRGREGMETYVGRLDDAWEDYRVVAYEFRDLGDILLTLGRVLAHGRGSGVPVETPVGFVGEYRDGKVSRLRSSLDQGEALREAGLTG